MSLFGDFGHHLQISGGDYIPKLGHLPTPDMLSMLSGCDVTVGPLHLITCFAAQLWCLVNGGANELMEKFPTYVLGWLETPPKIPVTYMCICIYIYDIYTYDIYIYL